MTHIESSVTSVSWIPSEAVRGLLGIPFERVGHHDPPPPERLEDLEALRREDRFRFANRLEGWIEVEDGRIVRHGQGGGGLIGSTTLRLGPGYVTVAAVSFPDLVPPPDVTETSVRFRQTAGGRTGVPFPRPVSRPPFVQISAPPAWSTLSLTLHADGRAEGSIEGASPFPRHWVYDHEGSLVAKTGVIDFDRWQREIFGESTPWGDLDSPAVVAPAVTSIERRLAAQVMSAGATSGRRGLAPGEVLCRQGDRGSELYLVLDGLLDVDVDGTTVARVGPGAILGERALLEGGTRTCTLEAVTGCRLAVFDGSAVDEAALSELVPAHDRERTL